DDPPVITTARARRVGEEHPEREQGSDDPEHGAEHARDEVGAVLELLGEVEAPEGCENAERGTGNAEHHDRGRLREHAASLDLALLFRVPSSAFRVRFILPPPHTVSAPGST